MGPKFILIARRCMSPRAPVDANWHIRPLHSAGAAMYTLLQVLHPVRSLSSAVFLHVDSVISEEKTKEKETERAGYVFTVQAFTLKLPE